MGRPGWHIECSAMSWKRLVSDFAGKIKCEPADENVFDIHGGGIDLVFPHHENEIAQSCCAFGASRMANVWMHNGFLQVEGEKMSKSLGNFVTINELLATEKFGGRSWDGQVLRLAMLRTHYTQPIDWTVRGLEESRTALDGWMASVKGVAPGKPSSDVIDALGDDLNTPQVVAELFRLWRSKDIEALAGSLHLLGFDEPVYHSGVRRAVEAAFAKVGLSDEEINQYMAARAAARAAKNCKESDRIRDELAAMGIQLKDAKDPVTGEMKTTWEVKR